MRARVRGPAFAAGVLLVIVVFALPAVAADAAGGAVPRESIPTYDVVLTLGRDGVVYVRETITYDFDRGGEQGIVRRVPFRRANRLFDVRGVSAGSSTGAPARARTMRLLNDLQITVGDRRREVRGRQAYVIEYAVGWAFTPYTDHDELVWDAIGTSWGVPIGDAVVRVESPVPLRHVTCRAGSRGATTRCLGHRDGRYAVDFAQSALAPHEGMTVRVRLPKHAISVAPPHYARPHWAGTWPGTAALALALVAVVLAARGTVPRRRMGALLAAVGALLIVSDAADDVLDRGPWAFSLGDRTLAGLAFVIIGAAVLHGRKSETARYAADGARWD
ncbi:DUF2207 domain-containing protein [Actinomadura napierensis]|uniref:DUF2207 domain-containing protein n=1 Tax=Actinomadura napierensis TaxID=267854 RepID=A0ABN3ACZ0_9ACTN